LQLARVAQGVCALGALVIDDVVHL
jgi:hypothetical protein